MRPRPRPDDTPPDRAASGSRVAAAADPVPGGLPPGHHAHLRLRRDQVLRVSAFAGVRPRPQLHERLPALGRPGPQVRQHPVAAQAQPADRPAHQRGAHRHGALLGPRVWPGPSRRARGRCPGRARARRRLQPALHRRDLLRLLPVRLRGSAADLSAAAALLPPVRRRAGRDHGLAGHGGLLLHDHRPALVAQHLALHRGAIHDGLAA